MSVERNQTVIGRRFLLVGLALLAVTTSVGFVCLSVLHDRFQHWLSTEAHIITQEEAIAAFTRDTGIAWPDSARSVRFDEDRVSLLGDGQFYILFTVPRELLETWLNVPPPWGTKRWLPGPIPPDIGHNCGFGFALHGYTMDKDGMKEYAGGAPEIMEVLTSKTVRYVARDRSPTDSTPWYNGNLLILDSETGVVRYSSWDK
jgi:hypothetical protein